ncbi:MAG: T9SS type A sorting domain-containing protein, partial [candidate division WOR-3 bacterium]
TSDPVKISPGAPCTLRVWVYDNDPAGRLRLAAFWNSSDNDFGPYSVDNANWQQLEMSVNAPLNSDSARFGMRAYDVSENWDGNAVFYIDDAEFITTIHPLPPFVKRIWHKPTHPSEAEEGIIFAEIIDDGDITDDSLYYAIDTPDFYTAISHSSINGDTLFFSIPEQSSRDTVFYYLWVKDDNDSTTVSDTNAYYVGNKGIVINEVCYDTPGSDTACFVELYGPSGVSLDGIEVVGVNGLNGKDYADIDLTGFSIPNDGLFVLAQDSSVPNFDTITSKVDFQNGPDNIELRFKGITIDALGYGNGDFEFTGEELPAPDIADSNSLSRYPDGTDTDDNLSDFIETSIKSPGEPNISGVEEVYSEIPLHLNFSPIQTENKKEFILSVRKKGAVSFSIHNILGQKVFQLKKDFTNTGKYKIEWNTQGISTGVYFCSLKSGKTHLTGKFLIVK